ncbi:MAG: hypothetical protein ACFBSF_22675, partial [Leptolyngbyaceae cyanobacterium]
MPAADFCSRVNDDCSSFSSDWKLPVTNRLQTSRGKHTHFRYTTAGFTLPVLDGYGLRYLTLTRPTFTPHYPVSVRRLIPLLHAAFRPHLAIPPLRFASLHLHLVGRGLSPPSSCTCPAHV